MIHSVASESPNGLLHCHKNNCVIPLLTMLFWAEIALGGDHFTLRCGNKGYTIHISKLQRTEKSIS